MKINVLNLKKIMAEKIVTVADLSRLAGVSATNINMIVNHDRKANTATVGKLAAALGVSVSDIIAE